MAAEKVKNVLSATHCSQVRIQSTEKYWEGKPRTCLAPTHPGADRAMGMGLLEPIPTSKLLSPSCSSHRGGSSRGSQLLDLSWTSSCMMLFLTVPTLAALCFLQLPLSSAQVKRLREPAGPTRREYQGLWHKVQSQGEEPKPTHIPPHLNTKTPPALCRLLITCTDMHAHTPLYCTVTQTLPFPYCTHTITLTSLPRC